VTSAENLSVAETYGLPMAYDGGIELFRSDPAKLLLAWLRILESDAERGWAVVLEEAGYTLDEVKHVLDSEEYPTNMQAFNSELASLETVGGAAQRVFSPVRLRRGLRRRTLDDDPVRPQRDDVDTR